MKLIVLLLGVVIGFGGGVWWGVKNPAQAQKLAAEEERRVLEKQKVLLQKLKTKLDQLAGGRTGSATTGAKGIGSGFVAGGQSSGSARPDAEVDQLRSESDQQIAELDRILQSSRQ